MSMTVTDANAVNVLCRYLLGPGAILGRASDEEAREALHVLVRSAYKRLSAGFYDQVLDARWGNPQCDLVAQQRAEIEDLRATLAGIARVLGLPPETPGVEVQLAVEQLVGAYHALLHETPKGGGS
jgi:hypothetical protein